MRKVTQRGPATDAQPRRIGRLPGEQHSARRRTRAAPRRETMFPRQSGELVLTDPAKEKRHTYPMIVVFPRVMLKLLCV
jgi:hypothetical protein